MDSNFVVYMHFVDGESEPFYIGEGRVKRSKSRFGRNRYWKFVVKKHGDFRVEIVADGLQKSEAEDMERKLITLHRSRGVRLTNICDGPMYSSDWLKNQTKENHPRFGARFDAPWIEESNRRRAGAKLQPRPDLVERNKLGLAKHYSRSVRCIETNQEFESSVAAAMHAGVHNSKICRALKEGGRSGGCHWVYVDPERTGPKPKPKGRSTEWRHGKLPVTNAGGAMPFINLK